MTLETFKSRINPKKNADVLRVDHILLCCSRCFSFQLNMWISGIEKGSRNILVYLPIDLSCSNLFTSTLESVWNDSGFRILAEEKVSTHLGPSVIFRLGM